MGEVISIKRSTDNDLLDQFLLACPEVPAQLNDTIGNAASQALGTHQITKQGLSFKTVCLVVAAACMLGVFIVRGISTRWHDAVNSVASYSQPVEPLQISAALPGEQSSARSWRRTQSEWAAYIQHLESDPFYQYVLEEKRRYQQSYPR